MRAGKSTDSGKSPQLIKDANVREVGGEPQHKDRTASQLDQEDLNCKYWPQTAHRHLYKMGYSSEDAICTYQRGKPVEIKAMKFCHNRGWGTGRRTWAESYGRPDECSRKACTLNKLYHKIPTVGAHLPTV